MLNEATKQATDWFVKLSSGEVTEHELQHWQSWRNLHPENEKAWQRIAQVSQDFKNLADIGANKTLQRMYDQPKSPDRRQALKQMGVFAAVGIVGYYAYQQKPWQSLMADYAVATGSTQETRLADGTKLTINTASLVNVDFNENARLVTLLSGEIYIETGHENQTKNQPFIVKTIHGKCIALGTRFSVRQYEQNTRVSVFEGAVQLIPENNQANTVTLNAGETAVFSRAQTDQPQAADPANIAWVKGFIIADEMPLATFTQELARYRVGYLNCAPEVAKIKISGAFPINNTDMALQLLTSKFPVKVQNFTHYWANITAL